MEKKQTNSVRLQNLEFMKDKTPGDEEKAGAVTRAFEIENSVLKKYNGNDSAVVIPNGVTKIADYAFSFCDSLKSIKIPDSVVEIAEYAFDGCESLINLEIPDSVKSIDSGAFYFCNSLESITVSRGNTAFHSNSNCLIETASKTLVLGCKNSVIPADESVKIIGDLAFCGCESLTDIKIPKGVTKIGNSAFYCCVKLKSIELPDGLTDIGANAFECCESLTDVKMPDSVMYIDDHAFYACAWLESIEIPKHCALGVDCFPENCKVIKAQRF